jgi:integrase
MGRGDGVEIRDASIRLLVVIDGVRHKVRLTLNGQAMKPTPANVRYAKAHAHRVRQAIDAGVFSWESYFPEAPQAKRVAEEAVTLAKLAKLWLDAKSGLAASTRDQYATAARFWLRLLGPETQLEKLTHAVLAAKIATYAWPSAKTHNNYLIALRGMLSLHYRGSLAVDHPLVGVDSRKPPPRRPDPLSASERDSILSEMRERYDERIHAYFLWQFGTGMRPEETIALRWGDLDLAAGTVRVQRVRTFRGGERDGTKTNHIRDVDLTPMALDGLRIMRAHTEMMGVEADIFQNPVTGKPWHDERSQRDHYWTPTLRRLRIRHRRAYVTRHTLATVALMAGVNPAYIAAQLGHSLQVLLHVYAAWLPGQNTAERDKLAAALRPQSVPSAASVVTSTIGCPMVGAIGFERKA